MSLYVKCEILGDARRVLEETIPQRNVVHWNVMISAYSKHGLTEEAFTLFYRMQRMGIEPDQFTFTAILPACSHLGSLRVGKKVHLGVIKNGFQCNVFVGCGLLDMYLKCGSLEDARKVFGKMSERNVVSWNAMVAGCALNGYVDEAMELFQKMPQRNVVSWTAMVAGYAQNGFIDEALNLFNKMPVQMQDEVSWTAIISAYAQNGQFDEALEIFRKMPERGAFPWTAMIAGYSQNGYFNEALELFGQMQLAGVKPNAPTLASVLPACAHLAALKSGKAIHKTMFQNGFQSNVFLGNALVDMYAKCGSIDNARKVFDKMYRRNVVTWTTMIVGYAMHGIGMEAIQVFKQMQNSDTEPNSVTLVGVLSACCHAGLVNDGWRYFNCMSKDYFIEPVMEHYCCMVDLLGRAGHLVEAEEFIHKMPMKPAAALWGSLLSACRVHANMELGERVAECVFALEPHNAINYVQLSNIYAMFGRWQEVENVRNLMKERKVQHMPGCSWIEINNKIYLFPAGE
jgi:pentatricopeptide repeat protein